MSDNVVNSEMYNRLSEDEKNKVDAVISFLSGLTMDKVKKILTTVSLEVDKRTILTHQ